MTYIGGAATFNNKNVGTNKTVTATGLSLSGTDAANYSVNTTAVTTANITPAAIANVTGISANNKVYDATTTATLNTGTAGFTGKIGTDVLAVATATGAFTDPNAGNGKTVNISGITLTGADAGNYTLTTNRATATANITARGFTVSANDATKIYGNSDPALSFNVGGAALAGGDTITSVISGALARAPGENVAASPYAINQGTLAANTNYSITAFTPGQFTITPRALSITADNKLKVTDNALPPLTATYNGFAFTDNPASLAGTLAFATAASALSPPGIYTLTPFGQSATNYSISYVNGALGIVNPLALPLPPGVLAAIISAYNENPGAIDPPTLIDKLITITGAGVNLPPGVK